ncbi:hypothetical protein EST38_g3481 [Candolleomyces aberdarensis]|uniref:L-type lectin-like domain-containing protein n=1 Tax=Candolleomyces aberdarensis TaxID=2316362 RepID=A0A4Q2DQF7_9AGAR|nr:hypothetical protein EST38_g3481 [Candolleomyces aberdarensis]
MSSRSWTLLSICLVLAQVFLGVALAKDDKTKLGNSTIERGWLWSRLALTASNYVIETEFKISGDPTHLYGDGMAMWITTERVQEGPIFGNKDSFKGLGIILDTYANDRHGYGFPRVVGVLLDGKTKYDYGNDGDSQALGGCSVNFRRTNVATKLKVTYVKDSFLDVKIQYKAWDDWTDCFFIPNITLPTNPYLGFSAMTGDVSDAHDIISVTSYSAILSPPEAPKNVMKKTKLWRPSDESTGGSSWFGLLFKLALFVGVCAGGWYGYQEYLRRQRYGGAGAFNFGGGLGSAGLGSAGLGSAGFGGPPSGGMYANSKRF